MPLMGGIQNWVKGYGRSEAGVSALESALMFPVLITMLVSMVDIGNAYLANQKLISAAQTMGDLVTREANPTLEQRAEAVRAGQSAMSPYSLDTFLYNISSYQFAAAGAPSLVWEESNGLDIEASTTNDLDDLGSAGEGVVAVRVTYQYQPFFTGFIIGPIDMEEFAFLRGRRSAVVGAPL